MKLKAALVMMLLCVVGVAGYNKKAIGESNDCLNICGDYSGDDFKACMKKCNGRNDNDNEYHNGRNHERHRHNEECPDGMAKIMPGDFMMGCSEGDSQCSDNEKPAHLVTITKGFCMDVTKVTQGAYERVIGSNPSYFKNCGTDCPVETVSWYYAQGYCKKIGKRLPTEAEWEYAARAGTTTAFYTGDITYTGYDCGSDPALDRAGWYCGNSSVSYSGCHDMSFAGGPNCSGTHPVGQKEPNAWGLYDMLGILYEWVNDWYDDKYYTKGGPTTDPQGPGTGTIRVLRGGAWLSFAVSNRVSNRYMRGPTLDIYDVGFRCAKDF